MSVKVGELPMFVSLSDKFSDLKLIGNGGGGIVLSAFEKTCKSCSVNENEKAPVALKRLSLVGRGCCRVALREVRLLKRLKHENLVRMLKITDANGSNIENLSVENFRNYDSIYLVEELLDTDLYRIMTHNSLSPDMTKLFLYQILRGVKYIHSANVIHRDIKPDNLFLNIKDLSLKIGDYGLSRIFDDHYEHGGFLTELVSTRYYRSPEIMFNLGNYSFAIDIWSVGCVFGEMLLNQVLFAGENDSDQLTVICEAFGITTETFDTHKSTFPQHRFDGFPSEAIDLLSKLLLLDAKDRITAAEALNHPFFSELHNPNDEPVCKQPFFIEDEIDNLPVNVLKEKILSNSSHLVHDNYYNSSQSDNVFEDFDETFSGPVRKRSWQNVTLYGRGNDFYHLISTGNSPDSGCSDNGYSSSDNMEDYFIPSLTVTNYHGESTVEPMIDPGVCERKYRIDDRDTDLHMINSWIEGNNVALRAGEATKVLNENLGSVNVQKTSYFSDLSPIMDNVNNTMVEKQ